MYFLVEGEGVFGKCNTILDKVSADIRNELDKETAYN